MLLINMCLPTYFNIQYHSISTHQTSKALESMKLLSFEKHTYLSDTNTPEPTMAIFFKSPYWLLEEKLIWFLQQCKTLKHLQQVHSHIIANGFEHSGFITPRIIASYGLLKEMGLARKVFDKILEPNVVDWNSMFIGYAKNDSYREVVLLFREMMGLDVMPNCFTFPVLIKSCIKMEAFGEGEELHCCVIKNGFKVNSFVGTTLIEMYSNGGRIGEAYKVFGEMVERNVVAWTSMINGYIWCHDVVSARRLFDLAPERDIVLWNTMISGYIEAGDMVGARKLFDKMPNKDVMSWNTVLNGYANNRDVKACERLFQEMPERNVFSWNIMLGGYAHNGCYLEVLNAFKRMLVDRNVLPNDVTLVHVVSACARLGALDLGKWVHMYAENNGYKGNLHIANALIDMYGKCGVIENALEVFKCMEKKDLVSWNTIIGGLAAHGRGADALSLFYIMKNAGEKPDGITFISLLSACARMGLVEDGFSYFQSMINDYSFVPEIEHYGCMVDLLARAGLLAQAKNFVHQMPIEADAVIWATLLGACRVHKNVEIAEFALKKLIELEPNNPANYVMLSNIYGDLGRWKDLAQVKVAARDIGWKKLPGCSSIEVNDLVVEFYALDDSHPARDDIYEILKFLTKSSMSFKHVPDLVEILSM